MSAPRHVVVCGAGVIGAAVAYFLSRRGVAVTVVERSGVLNLGVEGMMLVGAAVAVLVTLSGYGHVAAILAAIAAGALSSLVFGVLALTFLTNQYAAGLALAIVGGGVSALIGRRFGGAPVEALPKVLLGFDALVWASFALFAAVTWWLYRTRSGLTVRVIGESPEAAHAIRGAIDARRAHAWIHPIAYAAVGL